MNDKNTYTINVMGPDLKSAVKLARALVAMLADDDFQNVDKTAIAGHFGAGSALMAAQNLRENAHIKLVAMPSGSNANEEVDAAIDRLNECMRFAASLLDRLADAEATPADAESLYQMLEEVVAAHAMAELKEDAPTITFKRRSYR